MEHWWLRSGNNLHLIKAEEYIRLGSLMFTKQLHLKVWVRITYLEVSHENRQWLLLFNDIIHNSKYGSLSLGYVLICEY